MEDADALLPQILHAVAIFIGARIQALAIIGWTVIAPTSARRAFLAWGFMTSRSLEHIRISREGADCWALVRRSLLTSRLAASRKLGRSDETMTGNALAGVSS